MMAALTNRRSLLPFAADLLAVIVFVAIGRRTHDETGNVFVGAAKVAAPFLIAVAVGWLVARAWANPLSNATGAIIWLSTVIVGLLLRRFVFDRGTATPFIIVATAALCAFIMGWRGITRWYLARDN
ncbi:unannotated protein [freshwater metagenome]|uniref:Unannotated protein n=1 Tax=freshwater metagenome TaxID=449393 RepID=A0A6J7CLN1_9ZZZZ|nr:DUF3054 family protein [Actinomycetota bacterium]